MYYICIVYLMWYTHTHINICKTFDFTELAQKALAHTLFLLDNTVSIAHITTQ